MSGMENEMDLFNELCMLLPKENVLKDEPMSKHTTFRIGGAADFFVTPRDAAEVWQIIALCNSCQMPYYITGNGSNLLVGDKGYRGVMIQIGDTMNQIRTEGNRIYAQAGALLSKIAAEALRHELTGFEFASGIPGTLGGAIVMNAGAYGGEMKQIIAEARILDKDGNLRTLSVQELELGYRTSILVKKQYVAIDAVLELKKGNPAEIQATLKQLKEQRTTKQPLEYPSAGSAFKRPEGYFAGKLIEDAGLRGFRIGDAQVSEKHCGFVINRGQATAAEIVSLMEQVADRVKKDSGVQLEPEIKKIGEF